MAALGDKVSANILAQSAKVPSIPWSGDGIESGLNAEGVIPKDIFDSACVFTVDQAAAKAKTIGYPVMIKASEGGGGKGIRMAKDLEELKTNFVQVISYFAFRQIYLTFFPSLNASLLINTNNANTKKQPTRRYKTRFLAPPSS